MARRGRRDEGTKALILDPSQPQELIKQLEVHHERYLRSRAAADYRAKVNLAFYRNHQWLVDSIDSRSGSKTLRRSRPRRNDPPQLVFNLLRSRVKRQIAKLVKHAPVPEARPVTDEPDDRGAARVGTRVLASECSRLEWDEKLVELYEWVIPAGWSYLHPYWDPKDGDEVGEDDEGRPLHEGNICLEVVPFSEVVYGPVGHEPHLARWVYRTIALPLEEVIERWGKEPTGYTEVRSVGDELAALDGAATPEADKVAVRQFWLRRGMNRSLPEGLVVTWCGSTVLEEPRDFRYKHNHNPFIQLNFWPPQGEPWGQTWLTDALDPQKDYNHARSMEADIRDRLIPFILAARGTMDPDKMEAKVKVVDYQPVGPAPTPQAFDARWMAQWEQTMDRAGRELDELSASSEAARGQLAGTSPAATALSQAEAASEPLLMPAKSLANGVSECGWQMLELVRQYWDEPRLVRTYSESRNLEVARFSRSDIRRELDVRVSSESALPRSKAGKLSMFLDLWRNGLIPDPRVVYRALDLPSTDVLARTLNAVEAHAERENAEMAEAKIVRARDPETGEETVDVEGVPPVEDWHDHQLHIAVHNERRLDPDFGQSEGEKAAQEAHVRVHMMILAQRQQAQAQQGQAQAGQNGQGGPEGGAAGGPASGAFGQAFAPEMAAFGLAPSQSNPTTERALDTAKLAQIGGRTGRPGLVPGVSVDQEAAAIGE